MSTSISSVNGVNPTTMWENLFKKIDSNSDGSIDKTEFENAVSSMTSNQNISSSDADAMFAQLDSNSDGQVSKSEMMDALKNAGTAMQASMPPPPPPPMDNSQTSGQTESLTDDQKKTVDSILSKYDASNLTSDDVTAINKSISDAGINFNKALGDEIESQGFSIQTMMSLSPPPSSSSSTASASDASGSAASSQSDSTSDSALLSNLVNYLNSSNSSSASTNESSSSSDEISNLFSEISNGTGSINESEFTQFLAQVGANVLGYNQQGNTSLASSGLSESTFSITG